MAGDDPELRAGIEQLEAERPTIALEHFAAAADGAESPDDRRAAMAFAADASLSLKRPYETVSWAERLRAEGGVAHEADLLEAAAWVAIGDGLQALERLEGIDAVDGTMRSYPTTVVRQLRCEAFGLVGDSGAAVEEALAALRTRVDLPDLWRALAVVAARDPDVDLTAALQLLPDERLLELLGWLVEAPAEGTDRVVEAVWARSPGDRRVLALMTTVANQLPLERAVEWSARLREAGLSEQCAVLGIAAREDIAPRERVRAALVGGATFQDDRAISLLEVSATALPDVEVRPALDEVLEIGTDDAVDSFIVAAASSPRRSLDLSVALLERGATAPAVALAKHAVELSTGQPSLLREARDSAIDPEQAAALESALRDAGAHEVAAMLAE